MDFIRVYVNDDKKEFASVPLHYEFYFYHFLPYILLNELINIDPTAVGLFRLTAKNEKIS